MFQTATCVVLCVLSATYICAQSGFQDADVARPINNGLNKVKDLLERTKVFESRDHRRRLDELKHEKELNELRDKLELQKQTVASLRAESEEQLRELDQLRNNHQNDLVPRGVDSRGARIRHAAFFALIEPAVDQVDPGHDMIFQTVRYNMGDAYNPLTGHFVAPMAGTYVFAMSITTFGTFTTHVGFAVNGRRITEVWINGKEQSYATSGQNILLVLQKSDVVTVQEASSVAYVQGDGHSMFSGFMLYENEEN